MAIKIFTRNKRYMVRILVLTTLGILLILSFFAAALYYNLGKELTKNELNSATKLIKQIEFNFESIEDVITGLAVRTFFSSEVTNLMYLDQNKFDYVEYVEKSNNIVRDDVTIMERFIHSIYIYNNRQGKVLQVINTTYEDDSEFIRSVESGKRFPKLKPIIREIPFKKNGNEKEKVLTYFMYQYIDTNSNMDGAVIINVKSDWFTESIKKNNVLDKTENIFIIDDKGNFVGADSNSNNTVDNLSGKIIEKISKSYQKTGIFEDNINGIPHFITYAAMDNSTLILVKTQPVNIVYKSLKNIMNIIIRVTLIFILIAMITSFTISRRIYQPVKTLFNKVRTDYSFSAKEDEYLDEIGYIEKVYSESKEKIRDFHQKSQMSRSITRTYWLKKCLSEELGLDSNQYGELAAENEIKLSFNGYFSVLIFKIDDYIEFSAKNDQKDKSIIKFAIMNISAEIVSEQYVNEYIDMKEDHVALILETKDDNVNEFYKALEGLIARIRFNIKEYYGVSVTASVSGISQNINSLPLLYSTAVANSVYRFIFGKSSYITQNKIDLNNSTKTSDIEKLEIKLLESIKKKDIDKSKEEMLGIIGLLKEMDYDQVFLYIIRLTDTIKKTIEQLNSEKSLGYSDILKRITSLETIDEYYYVLESYFKQALMHLSEIDVKSGNQLIYEMVKEIVQSKYSDPSLCLQQIASMLKISPRKANAVFKEAENISVSNYIKEIRLMKVANLLETSRLNVNEIIEMVGIDNETYFYSIFRAKYGMTPKEFAIQKNIERLVENSTNL